MTGITASILPDWSRVLNLGWQRQLLGIALNKSDIRAQLNSSHVELELEAA